MTDKASLEKTLDVLIATLAKAGLLPKITHEEKENLKSSMIDTLLAENSYDLRKNHFLDKKVQKTLMSTLVDLFIMQKRPEFGLQFNIRQLFNSNTSNNDLKNIFKDILTLLNNKLKPENQLTKKQIEEALAKIMEKITKKSEQKDIPAQSETIANILEILMSETLRSLYGGEDPRCLGEIPYPLFHIVGNLIAAIDSGPGTSPGIIDEPSRVDRDRPDYLGTENITKQNQISLGVTPLESLFNDPDVDLPYKISSSLNTPTMTRSR